MEIYGKPAAFASSKRLNIVKSMALAGVVSLVGVVIILNSFPDVLSILGALGGVFLIGGAAFIQTKRVPYLRLASGINSEKRIAHTLKRMGPRALFHGLLLKAGGDADHVWLHNNVVVVETKSGTGEVRATKNGLSLRHPRFSRTLPGDPVGQSLRQAQKLSRLVNSQVFAVVCVVDMQNAPFQTRSTWVCSEKDLPRVLNSLPVTLDLNQQTRVLAKLKSL